MNCEPNTKRWGKGDLVIHDMDAKRSEFLMEVVTCDQLGWDHYEEFITNYVEERWRKQYPKGLRNKLAVLHDPQRFGIKVNHESGEKTDVESHYS